MTAAPELPEELSFEIEGLAIAAKRWNKGAPHKAIAVHGWLDNCSSFDPMAPHLRGLEIVALDSAGHGKSDFRSKDSQYLIWSEVAEIFEIADQLGWGNFNLVGHSRGAGITALCAGTFPDRIIKLVLIEGGIPLPMSASEAPENLAKHILDNKRLSGTKGTIFKTKDDALVARANGFTKVNLNSSGILAARSLLEENEGFRWHADARLKAPSSFKLTHQQIDAFLDKISCPVLFIEGTEGILKQMSFTDAHLRHLKKMTRVEFPGGHHLHMEESTLKCAEKISEFLYEQQDL